MIYYVNIMYLYQDYRDFLHHSILVNQKYVINAVHQSTLMQLVLTVTVKKIKLQGKLGRDNGKNVNSVMNNIQSIKNINAGNQVADTVALITKTITKKIIVVL